MSIIIKIENVQSVKSATINIEENALNIKYGYNGLGKSSIGKMIDYSINNLSEEIEKLTPYDGGTPAFTITNSFDACMSFNRDYIDKWLFQGNNNIINESYSVFFNDDLLINKEKEINDTLLSLSKNVTVSLLNEFVEKVNKIGSQLKFNKDNTINGASTVGKGFKNGPAYSEKISKSDLKQYSTWINNPKSPDWFSWFNNGNNFVINDKCPFCTQIFREDFNEIKEKIIAISKENDFKKNNTAKQIVIDLSTLVNKSKKVLIESINTIEEPLSKEQQELLAESYYAAKVEKEKIESLINQNRFSFKAKTNKEEIKKFYLNNKLDINFFDGFGKEIKDCASLVNLSIDELIKEFDDFYSLMNDFNNLIKESINNAENEINTFLKYAGIPYIFSLGINENGESFTMLKPIINTSKTLEDAVHHLSYGEMNVLSLALFGAIAKRKKYDFIILDDPISSFDENKKFAVIHYLFNEINGVLKDKTVILLTHDMEPLLDIIKNDFIKINKNAHLLINNKGVVSEKEIKKSDIQNVINTEYEQAHKNSTEYLQIIHLRRYHELIGTAHSNAIYQVLSNAEHLRSIPTKRDGTPLDSGFVNDGIDEIKKVIPNFNYNDFISNNSLNNLLILYKNSKDNYEKIRLIRPILDNNTIPVDEKLKNFITENYHIENLYLYTILNVKQVPDYIINLCDELITTIETEATVI